jgi:hypothetical protein
LRNLDGNFSGRINVPQIFPFRPQRGYFHAVGDHDPVADTGIFFDPDDHENGTLMMASPYNNQTAQGK